MKLCTKLRVKAYDMVDGRRVIKDAEIMDMNLVPDDHDFGYGATWPENGIIHIEGGLTNVQWDYR